MALPSNQVNFRSTVLIGLEGNAVKALTRATRFASLGTSALIVCDPNGARWLNERGLRRKGLAGKCICTTTDVDTLLYHMNNARYLRELDFARADFYERTSLYREICSQGSGVVQGAATIRYRRFVKPLSIFKITSKIIYWDERSVFMEHRFITPNDGFIRAIAICRQRLLDCSAEAVIGSLMERGVKQTGNVEAGVTQMPHVRPEMPPEVARWLESNEISSALLRQAAAVTTNC
ncbi:protein THEM6 isoform X2 [Nomia melanderi]|nr:protein THEM6 isoform X2 [Nomia melanderi]